MQVDEKRYILAFIAAKYAARSKYRYEINELINEAWLCPNVRKMQRITQVFNAGRWAMISYMRREEKRGQKWQIHLEPLETEDGHIIEPEIWPENAIDYIDELNHIKNARYRQIIALRLGGYTWAEIAETMGKSPKAIWQEAYEARKRSKVS